MALRVIDNGGAAPPKTDPDDPVAIGREAWGRRKADARASWNDWVQIGAALMIGRHQVENETGCPPGHKRYNEAFSQWIKVEGFGDIDNADRMKLLYIMKNLPSFEAWRDKLPEGRRVQLNHPSSVWKGWRKDQGFLRPAGTCKTLRDQDQGDQDQGDQDQGDQDQRGKWDPANLMVMARQGIGPVARLKGYWPHSEPPDIGLVQVWWEFAHAVVNIANILDEACGLSPEENLPLKVRCKRELAATPFLTEEEFEARPSMEA